MNTTVAYAPGAANAAKPANNANASAPSNSGSPGVKTGTLAWDTALREFPEKDAPQVGIHYRNARVRILDVADVQDENGKTVKWYKVEVTQYGTSVREENEGQEKDPYSGDIGWVHSNPEIYYGVDMRRKRRISMVKLDR